MRREYAPAIILYVISAIFCVVSAYCAVIDNHHWATVGLLGIIIMLFASSRLVKIGNKLRKEDEKEEVWVENREDNE